MTEIDKQLSAEDHTDSQAEDDNHDETKTSKETGKHRHKIKISDEELEEKLVDFPEIIQYIQQLNKLIRKQVKKISKWKSKAKSFIRKKDVTDNSTQTDFTNSNGEVDSQINGSEKVKDIVKAAQQAVENSGFVYEESSGLYYDYSSGLYYNAEYGLYYDGKNGTYLKYNQETQDYEFHSQVTSHYSSAPTEKTKRKNVTKKPTKDRKRRKCHDDHHYRHRRNRHNSQRHHHRNHSDVEAEEGECTTDDSYSSSSSSNDEGSSGSSTKSCDDLSKRWPPCMRLIIESTDITKLKPGSLYVITCDGGTIGREGSDHAILLPEINVSKHHLKFLFDRTKSKYMLIDLGSRNGTVLDGKRLSASKQESEAVEILHGSKLQIASTIFLCHIHDGNQTCGHCEPGLLLEKDDKDSAANLIKHASQEDYKTSLRKLKKRHGFLHYGEEEKIELAVGYTDRAQQRRQTIGSQNPYEKTQTASVDENISSENKGFRLLSKMGWKSGESLGKNGKGLIEPVKVVPNIGTSGMGAHTATLPLETSSSKNKQIILKKTQERFETLPDIFTD